MRSLTLRARLSAAFALAVFCALLCFGAAATAVLWLDEAAEQRAHPGAGADDFDDVRRAAYAMLAVSPLVIAAAAFAGNLLAKRAVAPIQEASRRARSARVTGSALELPRARQGEEWDELARTLNALLADGRASYERIQRFTADAAHELRNPVTTLLGESELALRRSSLRAEDSAAWGAVHEEAERLRALLDALLSLARADAGQLIRTRGEVDLDALAAEVARRCATRAAANGREISVRGSAGTVQGDPTLLRRALENLVDNGLTHAAGKVFVRLERAGEHAFVRVEDDGPGVPRELREQIFERFFRAEQPVSAEGFGLGLSIALAIARAHGGALRYVEAGPGACFELSL